MNIASIGSLEDALLLYDDAVAYWSELQEALAAAMNWLQEAMLDFHKTQDHLGEADFQLGKTQYIFRKSGYGEILSKKHGFSKLMVWFSFLFFPQLIHYLLTSPGRDQHFTVKLDWINFVTVDVKCILNILEDHATGNLNFLEQSNK